MYRLRLGMLKDADMSQLLHTLSTQAIEQCNSTKGVQTLYKHKLLATNTSFDLLFLIHTKFL